MFLVFATFAPDRDEMNWVEYGRLVAAISGEDAHRLSTSTPELQTSRQPACLAGRHWEHAAGVVLEAAGQGPRLRMKVDSRTSSRAGAWTWGSEHPGVSWLGRSPRARAPDERNLLAGVDGSVGFKVGVEGPGAEGKGGPWHRIERAAA